ncbi:hypothetical protein FB451DRAFT_1445189 [Mycena latifolia]|nr:hypothetical protein FB451DRAFT_1445189 [Mycena latifolia]
MRRMERALLADRENQDSVEFRTFRRNLFHGSLRPILESFRPAMTVPEVAHFADGHYRRVIYGLGPYIADYPEQVLLACTVQGWCARCTASNKDLDGPSGRRSQRHTEALFDAFDHKTLWDDYGVIPDVLPFTWTFPRADIHELLSPDLLHQIIKGTFKDHLVTWVGEYLEEVHGKSEAKKIMADIDRRYENIPCSCIQTYIVTGSPLFLRSPGLRRFPECRGFKQWTGDDSKALTKRVPRLCYLVRRNIVGEATLGAIDAALVRYHAERKFSRKAGVCPNGFCLPRQHSLTHYRYLIQEVQRSEWSLFVNHRSYEALHQMLTINDRLDKLAAARVDSSSAESPEDEDEDDDLAGPDDRDILGEVKLARNHSEQFMLGHPALLAHHLHLPALPALLRRFLHAQDNPDLDVPLAEVPLDGCPDAPRSIRVFPSAIATFYAPSDQSGIGGQCALAGRSSRYDCVYVEQDTEKPGFRGLLAARVLLFMSFKHEGVEYPCALVTWFSAITDEPCPDVRDVDGAHLVPIFGDHFLPRHFKYSSSLDSFRAYSINKYADHHSHEIAF